MRFRVPLLVSVVAAAAGCLDEAPPPSSSSEAQALDQWHHKFDAQYRQAAYRFGFEGLADAAGFGPTAGNPPAPRERSLLIVRSDEGCNGTFSDTGFARTPAAIADVFFGSGRSVRGFYLENSSGRFRWTNAGMPGVCVTQMSANLTEGPAITTALQNLAVDLRAYDRNHDGEIWNDELTILVMHDNGGIGGQRRAVGSGLAVPDSCVITAAGNKLCGSGVIADDGVNLATLVHELGHTLGAIDLYGEWPGAPLHGTTTIMGGTIGAGMSTATRHFDPWHKMQLGWLRPDLVDITAAPSGEKLLYCAQDPRAEVDGSILFWNGNRGPNAFFLLESRCRGSYDDDLGDAGGLALWAIEHDEARQPLRVKRSYPVSLGSCEQVDVFTWECDARTVCLNDTTHWANAMACVTSRLLHRGDNTNGWAKMAHRDGSTEPTWFRVINPVRGEGFRVQWYTGTTPPPYPTLAAPTNVSVTAVGRGQLNVSWTFDRSSEATDIEVTRHGGESYRMPTDHSGITFGNLPPSSSQTFSVCALRADVNERACAPDAYGSTLSDTPPPPMPPRCPTGMIRCNGVCKKPTQCQQPE